MRGGGHVACWLPHLASRLHCKMDWVPPAVRDHERDIQQAISTLETGLRRTPSDPEIADQLGT